VTGTCWHHGGLAYAGGLTQLGRHMSLRAQRGWRRKASPLQTVTEAGRFETGFCNRLSLAGVRPPAAVLITLRRSGRRLLKE